MTNEIIIYEIGSQLQRCHEAGTYTGQGAEKNEMKKEKIDYENNSHEEDI
uniref:Uncharacterized protein n=1 Tax=Oryza sativa subsp. japonica TaxID=39947 RepID=Q2R473_ORYSJ|nr:hypothetical protein LOC_Os11g29460 [Oryza sativa Japonica Group]